MYCEGMTQSVNLMRTFWLWMVLVVAGIASVAAGAGPVRGPDEDVNSPQLRARPGLQPNAQLLFNGWGVTPAGEHVPMSDLALKLVVAPDGKRLLAAHGGFNQHGLTLFDIASHKQTQFLPLSRSWNGLVFSADGRQCFVSGGSSGQVHVFNYADGAAAFDRSVKPDSEAEEVFLAGMAVHPGTESSTFATRAKTRSGCSIRRRLRWNAAFGSASTRTLACWGPITSICTSATGVAGR